MVREQHAERALVAGPCRREEGSFIGVAVKGIVRHRFVTGVKRAHPSELIGPQRSMMEQTIPVVTSSGRVDHAMPLRALADAVRDLYRARWGEPTRQAHFEVEEFAIDVLKWDADANPEGVTLYVTVGAGARPLPGRDPCHRVEFFAGLLPAQDGIASPLAALGLYSAREGVALDHGHTVPGGSPLWPGSSMHTCLVVRSRDDFLPPLELPDGLHVEFLQAIPLFDPELEPVRGISTRS